MNGEKRPFQYRLGALLRKHQWEAQLLALDGSRAHVVMESKRRVYGQTKALITRTEAEIRALYEAPEGIALERRAILQTFLNHQRVLAASQEKEAAQAELMYSQIMAQLQSKRTHAKIIEKHRERRKKSHDKEDRGLQLKRADEMWLLRKARG